MRYLLPLLLVTTSVFAQQQEQDPALAACQLLLSNANAQTIQIAARAQTLAKQLEDAKAELAKLKPPNPEPDKPKP